LRVTATAWSFACAFALQDSQNGPARSHRSDCGRTPKRLGIHGDALKAAFTQWDLLALQRRVGWQPSRFLTDRAEAERAFALAERLGSVNAAAQQLGTTWPSLRKAFTRHGLGVPARNPEAVRQRAIQAARQRSGRPATPSLDPVFVALNHGEIPTRARSGGELAERVRRAEDYATLGARVVVELHSESHAANPRTRAWAITRRADRAYRRHLDREQRGERHRAGRGAHQPSPARAEAGCRCPITQPPTISAARHGSAPTWWPTGQPACDELADLVGELSHPLAAAPGAPVPP
jgi:hypothetical protein